MSQDFIERLFADPSLNGTIPGQVQFSPDSGCVCFLAPGPDDRERLDLYRYAIADNQLDCLVDARSLGGSGDGSLTDEERAERERRRAFAGGITGYRWLPDSRRLLLVCDGAAFLFTEDSGAATLLTPPGRRQTGVRLSPGGGSISYVRAGDLYRIELSSGLETRLTEDADACVSNGSAEFIAQEEMHRFDGHWWSPDERTVVFCRVDVSKVAQTHRYEMTAEALIGVEQRYPYAGAANAAVTLWSLALASGQKTQIHYQDAASDYLARVNVDSAGIWVQNQSRDQTTVTLKHFDFDANLIATPLVEQHDTWVNLHDNLTALPDSQDFLWTSERAGRAQLLLYRDGKLGALEETLGRVNEIVHADRDHALVLGWQGTAVEQHLFRIWYDPSRSIERLSSEPGWHEAVIAPNGQHWVDRYTSLEQPPRLSLQSLAGEPGRDLAPNTLDDSHPYAPYLADHVTPTLGVLQAQDGQTLHYRLTVPVNFEPTRRYPVLVNVYGGPGAQRVRNDWASLTLQLFARAGIVSFELDNRGGGNRSKSFEDPIHGRLGDVEVTDQLTGVEFLKSLDWIDPDRIGVFGHSYGGYMTLMCLLRAPEVFRTGVSVAPVTDWRLYDSHYTERYLGLPEANPDGYADSGVLKHLDRLARPLLVMHGMADDNVLFTNSTKLFQALQARHQPFEMMTYPGAKHAMQQRDVAIHRYQTMLEFLARELLA